MEFSFPRTISVIDANSTRKILGGGRVVGVSHTSQFENKIGSRQKKGGNCEMETNRKKELLFVALLDMLMLCCLSEWMDVTKYFCASQLLQGL